MQAPDPNFQPNPCPDVTTNIHEDIYNIKFVSTRTLKILYMNAKSINNKQEELEYILKSVEEDIHVICITKTWVKEGEERYFEFNGYVSQFASRPNKAGGGAGILIKSRIKHEITNKYNDDINSIITAGIYTTTAGGM